MPWPPLVIVLSSSLFFAWSKKLRLPTDPMKGQPLSLKRSFCSDGFSTLLGMEFLLLHGSPEVPVLQDPHRPPFLGPSRPDLLSNWHTSPYFRLRCLVSTIWLSYWRPQSRVLTGARWQPGGTGGEGAGRGFRREGTPVCPWQIHTDVQQRPSQHLEYSSSKPYV